MSKETTSICEDCGDTYRSYSNQDSLCDACAELDSVITFGMDYNCEGKCQVDDCEHKQDDNTCKLTSSGDCDQCTCTSGYNI